MTSASENGFADSIKKFINSRKSPETQADAQLLINVFLEAREVGDGWIRTNEIQRKLLDTHKIKSQKTLFRFLKELVNLDIIDKDARIEPTSRSHSDKTKENIYYRLKVPPGSVPPLSQSARTARVNTLILSDCRRKLGNAIIRLQKYHPEMQEDDLKFNPEYQGPPDPDDGGRFAREQVEYYSNVLTVVHQKEYDRNGSIDSPVIEEYVLE